MFNLHYQEHLQQLSEQLSEGTKENRIRALRSLSIMRYDPQAESILQAELARVNGFDLPLVRALARFHSKRHILFLSHLFVSEKHTIVHSVFMRMTQLIVNILNRSLNQ